VSPKAVKVFGVSVKDEVYTSILFTVKILMLIKESIGYDSLEGIYFNILVCDFFFPAT
jgi:hypothetical protein